MKTLLFLLSFLPLFCYGQQTVQERLGYPKNTILLIIHADDLGVAHAENQASTEAMEKGVVNSASILVPCAWFPEIADYARKNPKVDFGIHLALTSEWQFLKWGAVSSRNQVPSLHDDRGFFPNNTEDVVKNAKTPEVKTELKAQVDRALQFGIDITHLDSHMGTVLSHPEFARYYIELGEQYKVPVLMTSQILQAHKISPESYKGVLLDRVIIASPQDYPDMAGFYNKQLQSLQPGLNCLLLHAAFDNDEAKGMCTGFTDYGAHWRQLDYNYFTSDECRKLLKEKNIQLITWREIRDKLYRK